MLRYLVGSADMPADVNRGFDIGGPDVLTYADMMQRYAKAAGLPRRRMLKVPVLSPTLSSHWVGLITPVPGGLARPLVESLRNTVVCREHDIATYVPDPPTGLIGLRRGGAAGAGAHPRRRRGDALVERQRRRRAERPDADRPRLGPGHPLRRRALDAVDAPADVLWRVIEGIGGTSGWYSWSRAWAVRGWIDRLWGGPGLRRGRRNPSQLMLGDALDFWRVEDIVDGELLRLRAEMKLPGRAWLDLGIVHDDAAGTLFHQRAVFAPKGLWGRLYWWSVYPFHGIVFGGMQRNIARQAERAGGHRGRGRTVVVTATIDGRCGTELKPNRTGGTTPASGPRSAPSQVATAATMRWRSVAP